jgi:hypothetical protein
LDGLGQQYELAGDALVADVVLAVVDLLVAAGARVDVARLGMRAALAHVERRQGAREQEILDG